MRPTRLVMNDFRGHASTDLSFSPGVIYSVTGEVDGNPRRSTGAGKSTIFHAMNFALWGRIDDRSDVTLDELVRDGAGSCSVEFLFQTDRDVRVVREIKKRKSGASASLTVWVDGEKYATTTSRDAQSHLESMLEFNSYTWFRAPMKTQGADPSFLTATPERRVESLTRVLGIDGVISAADGRAKERLDAMRSELSSVEGRMAALDEQSLDEVGIRSRRRLVSSHGREIEKKRGRMDELPSPREIESIESRRNDLRKEVVELVSRRERTVENARRDAERRLGECEDRMKEIAVDRDRSTASVRSRMDTARTRLADLKEEVVRTSVDGSVSRPDGDPDEIEADAGKASDELSEMNDRLSDLRSEREGLKVRLESYGSVDRAVCPILHEECDRIDPSVLSGKRNEIEGELARVNASGKELRTEVEDLSRSVERMRERASEIRRDLSRWESHRHAAEVHERAVDNLRKSESALLKEIGNCEDELGRIDEDHRERMSAEKKKADRARADAERAEESVADELVAIDGRIEKAREAEDELRKDAEGAERMSIERERLSREIDEMVAEVERAKADLARHEEIAASAGEVAGRRKELRDDIETWEKIRSTFGKKGFVRDHVARLTPALETAMNRYLRFFDDGRLSIRIEDDITITDTETGRSRTPHTISEGQRSLVAFCYNAAVIRLRFDGAPSARMVCMDEPFVHLDEVFLESGMSVIRHLFGDLGLSNAFVITHQHPPNHPDNMRFLRVFQQDGVSRARIDLD